MKINGPAGFQYARYNAWWRAVQNDELDMSSEPRTDIERFDELPEWSKFEEDGFPLEIHNVRDSVRCYYCKQELHLGKLCNKDECWARLVLEKKPKY